MVAAGGVVPGRPVHDDRRLVSPGTQIPALGDDNLYPLMRLQPGDLDGFGEAARRRPKTLAGAGPQADTVQAVALEGAGDGAGRMRLE